jgi:hypothetical protein
MTRFEARLISCNNDCVLCRQGRGIWRHPKFRRFYICDECFAADRHLQVTLDRSSTRHELKLKGSHPWIFKTFPISLEIEERQNAQDVSDHD